MENIIIMNRSRRAPISKSFVSGGAYDPARTQQPQQSCSQPPEQVQQAAQQKQSPQTPAKKEKEKEEPRSLPVKASQPVVDPVAVAAVVLKEDDTSSYVDENGKLKFKKIFLARKKSSVRAKEKKIRQNRRLRKAIFPKNALMALNEVKGIAISEFNISASTTGGFIAVVTVNDKQYEGKGSSKNSAKNSACEKALRDYVLEKMRQNPRFPKGQATDSQAMDTIEVIDDDESEQKENGADGNEETDDVPMINLASFAIYKLFNEWENEGYVVPELHPSAAAAATSATPSENGSAIAPKEPKKAPIRTELPANWEAMHPATLLCMMRPGLTYTEGGVIGEKPNILQVVKVVVDGNEYIGYGRSKKSARRNVAVAVCNALFSTNFVKEEPSELVVAEETATA